MGTSNQKGKNMSKLAICIALLAFSAVAFAADEEAQEQSQNKFFPYMMNPMMHMMNPMMMGMMNPMMMHMMNPMMMGMMNPMMMGMMNPYMWGMMGAGNQAQGAAEVPAETPAQ